VAEAPDGGTIEVWGDGTAIRAYTYVDDLVEGVCLLMHSDPWAGSGQRLEGPVNIGSCEYVTVDELVETVIEVAGKQIYKRYVEGPVGVQARNFSKERIQSLGWRTKVSLKACPEHSRRKGIARTYSWIEAQVKATR